jgi:hypothetical protein
MIHYCLCLLFIAETGEFILVCIHFRKFYWSLVYLGILFQFGGLFSQYVHIQYLFGSVGSCEKSNVLIDQSGD